MHPLAHMLKAPCFDPCAQSTVHEHGGSFRMFLGVIVEVIPQMVCSLLYLFSPKRLLRMCGPRRRVNDLGCLVCPRDQSLMYQLFCKYTPDGAFNSQLSVGVLDAIACDFGCIICRKV